MHQSAETANWLLVTIPARWLEARKLAMDFVVEDGGEIGN